MYSVFVFSEKVMKFFRIHLKKCYWKLKYGKRIKFGKNLKFRKDFSINIAKNGYLKIGDGCFFNNSCSINCHKRIVIGNNNIFGEGVKIYDHNHIFNDRRIDMKTSYNDNEINIGNDNWFASNTVILSKATVGDNCVFGANTIVNEKINSGYLIRAMPEISITKIRFKG